MPTVFDLPKYLLRTKRTRTTRSSQKAAEPQIASSSKGGETPETEPCIDEEEFETVDITYLAETTQIESSDVCPHSDEVALNPTDASTQTDVTLEDLLYLDKTGEELVETKCKLNKERVRSSRLRKKISDYEGFVKGLQDDKIISDDLAFQLTALFDSKSSQLLQNEVTNSGHPPTRHRYSTDIRRFCGTVFFHSPSTYTYLRQFLTLPHPQTLRKWLTVVNDSPGFTSTSLNLIKKNIMSNSIEPECVLICDSMSIRKQVVYSPSEGRNLGYVDLGFDTEDTRLAGEALVFLVSGLRGKWRYPVGYFLVGKLYLLPKLIYSKS